MGKTGVIKGETIDKIYGYGRNSLKVLKDVSLEITGGEIVSIIGPSGAGKSTLLNLIGCLDSFNNGKLNVLDKDVSKLSVEELSGFRNKHLGFIFQQHNLLSEFSALENIMIPLMIGRVRKSAARKRAMELLEKFNLKERANHLPSELSGGECQRITVARAIVGKPDIILADEPTGSLDSENSRLLIETLFSMARENGITILIVTHDLDIASLTERTISLKDGKIV